jgi:hypothetical protein
VGEADRTHISHQRYDWGYAGALRAVGGMLDDPCGVSVSLCPLTQPAYPVFTTTLCSRPPYLVLNGRSTGVSPCFPRVSYL